jgi:hypothetical protein
MMGYLPMRSGILMALTFFGAEAFIDPTDPCTTAARISVGNTVRL